MKKIILHFFYVSFFIFLLILLFLNSSSISQTIQTAFVIWKENLFPTLFPIFVISEILIALGFIPFLGTIFHPFIVRFLKLHKNASYILFLSMLTGFPSSAKYISQLYQNKELDYKNASKILLFSHFSNPLFIIATIATTFLNNTSIIPLLFISHYLPNFLLIIFLSFKSPSKKENIKFSFYNATKAMYDNYSKDKKSFGAILGRAITGSINTLLLILGSISIFLVFTTVFNSIVTLPSTIQAIINGMLEMSQGLKCISLLSISLRLKVVLSVMIISFGGFCVHLQIMSILSDTKIKYFPFFIARLYHTILSGIIAYFLFPLFN